MIKLLFNASFLWDVLIFIGGALIIYACIKYPSAKWFVGTILGVALVVSTCYCSIQLNYYYGASGGIYGKISGIFNTNIVEVKELNFSLSNVELVKEFEDIYSAKVLNSNVIKLNGKDNFAVYVNNEPCTISQVENEEDYCIANYTYTFYDKDKNILCEDTLTFHFAFYTNSTFLSVTTNGGADAVKYWNYYFNKNVFDIRLEKIDIENKNQISVNKGDVSNFNNYCFITFITNPDDNRFRAEDGTALENKGLSRLETQCIKKGTKVSIPIFNASDYFHDIVYQYVDTQLVKMKLVSFSYFDVNGFHLINLNLDTLAFYENMQIAIFPVYQEI